MKVKFFAFLLITALICALCSCQTIATAAEKSAASGNLHPNLADAISSTSRAIGNATERITPEQEYYIGRAVAANILATYRVWNGNPALTSYLNMICGAITINSPRPDVFNGYHVAILDTNEINAFATPGGHIFLTRGLISAAKTEDALAAVIAHEVAHIQLQHSIKAIRSSRITQALVVTGASAVGTFSPMNVNELTDVFNESIGEIMTTLVANGYSRNQEFEADTTAVSLLAGAGYNPSGLIDMLNELSKIQGSSTTGFGKTHPTPAQRISNVERAANRQGVVDNSQYRKDRFQTSVR